MGAKISIRKKDGEKFITDNGNYIFDCDFGLIKDPSTLCKELNRIPGVVENGIFSGMADLALIALKNGEIEIIEA